MARNGLLDFIKWTYSTIAYMFIDTKGVFLPEIFHNLFNDC